MLNVALFELMSCASQYVLAHESGNTMHEGEPVLQLVSESVSSAHLIKTGSRRKTTVVYLIRQPFG